MRALRIVLALRPLVCDNQVLLAIGKDVDENQTINNVSVFVCLRATVTL